MRVSAGGVYCYLVGERVIVFHAFVKKTQVTPERDLQLARRRMEKARRRGADTLKRLRKYIFKGEEVIIGVGNGHWKTMAKFFFRESPRGRLKHCRVETCVGLAPDDVVVSP